MNLGTENERQEFKLGLGQLDKGLKSLAAMYSSLGITLRRNSSNRTTANPLRKSVLEHFR